MDALAHLALMAKAKLVFENPDTFMCFPALDPIDYTSDQLNFGAFNSPSVHERLVYSEFSRFVNALPKGTIFAANEKFLWETYGNVLDSAILAQGMMSAAETADYQRALALLGSNQASGQIIPSPQLLAYQHFRDAWFEAVQKYKTEQSTAASLTDPSAQRQWASVDEPRLRGEVDQTHEDWTSKGFKGVIEHAQQVSAAFSSRSPALVWAKWKESFNPDLDLLTDPNQVSYGPTGFMPADIFKQDWPTFRITSAEFAQLITQAPKELKDIFGADSSQSAVDQLAFEYRSVKVSRPWFRPEVFEARFWRLPDGAEPVCDGAAAKGSFPAYIAALVFVRNIQVTLRGNQAVPPTMIRGFPALRVLTTPAASPSLTIRLAPAVAFHPMMAAEGVGRPDIPIAVARPAPTTTPAPQPPHPVADPKTEISILAFICKRLPKSPDPDLTLTWTTESKFSGNWVDQAGNRAVIQGSAAQVSVQFINVPSRPDPYSGTEDIGGKPAIHVKFSADSDALLGTLTESGWIQWSNNSFWSKIG